LTVWAMTGISI
jgi:hypothetical protein